MKSGEVELLHGLDLLRLESGLGGVGNRADFVGLGLPCESCAAVGFNRQLNIGQTVASCLDSTLDNGLGGCLDGLAEENGTVSGGERNLCLLARGGEYLQRDLPSAVRSMFIRKSLLAFFTMPSSR